VTATQLCGIAKAEDNPGAALAAIEKGSGGRLGVFASAAGGVSLSYRAAERFPMCSTFKVLAVSAVLQRVDRGQEQLERRISYGRADLLAYAPVTTAHVAEGAMSISQLCEAAIVVSDNTAANLLLRTLGGPEAVTAFVRARPFDDTVTRLDRIEPELNSAIPGDPRDTTAPARMAHDLTLLLTTHEVLSAASSHRLQAWMRNCKTGLSALRAGVPPGWIAGDKTGSGANGTQNDVAIFRRPQRAPLIVAAYLTGATALTSDERSSALARVGRIVAGAFA
jgi:beta-lactamase class A